MSTNAALIEAALGPPSAERARGLITNIQRSDFPVEFGYLALAIDAIRNGYLTDAFYEYIRVAAEKTTDPDLLRDLIEFVNNTMKGVSASNLDDAVKQRAQSRLQLIVPILNDALQTAAQPAASNAAPSPQVTSTQQNTAAQPDCTLPWVLFGVAAALCLLMLLVIVLMLVRRQREKSLQSLWMLRGDRSSQGMVTSQL